ncbi:hypothetical protein [Lysobacter capsici]|uniref:hypothetical protein n=1 Tax=Lysobacter capsici TaxID=435897 RepID=UPI001C001BD3|nr:hypothetical protein [Lysobacter capsici]QWF18860.1 hypothetical protein KME82_09040 [Lysobacter capsici]
MRNLYRFAALRACADSALVSSELASARFFAMLAVVHNPSRTHSPRTLDALAAELADGRYWLAQKRVVAKGRTRRFAGAFAIARKPELIEFLAGAIDSGDLREMLIAAEREDGEPNPNPVVQVGEDGRFDIYAPA